MQPLKAATKAGITVSYGILTFTASAHTAVGEDESSATRTVCVNKHEATPIKSKYICPECGLDDRAQFVRAVETPGGFVEIPLEVIEADREASKQFSSLSITTHPAEEVTGVLLPSGKSYYLSLKDKKQSEAYSALVWLIRNKPELAFMAKLALRTAVSVMRLTVAGDGTLVLSQMADAELVREHPQIELVEISETNQKIAGMLADELTVPFVESAHGSGKTNIIAEYAQANMPTAGLVVTGAAPDGVTSLTDVLQASLNAAKKAKAKRKADKGAKTKTEKVPA